MTVQQWYLEREAQAKRRVEWSEKIETLLAPQLHVFQREMRADPVTGDPVLEAINMHGPRDLLGGARIELFGEPILVFKVAKNAKSMTVEPINDLYPSIHIVDIVGTPGNAVLNFVDRETKLPDFKGVPLSTMLTRVLERRLEQHDAAPSMKIPEQV